jgi:lipid-binding SYLF domain-containing protein
MRSFRQSGRALGLGGARVKGQVYNHNLWVGDVPMNELSIGFQAGGKALNRIIFFEDKRARDEFRGGSFQFGADAGVAKVPAGASASSGTTGTQPVLVAVTHGQFYMGMGMFTIAKGGLMGQVSIEGEKFTYSARNVS